MASMSKYPTEWGVENVHLQWIKNKLKSNMHAYSGRTHYKYKQAFILIEQNFELNIPAAILLTLDCSYPEESFNRLETDIIHYILNHCDLDKGYIVDYDWTSEQLSDIMEEHTAYMRDTLIDDLLDDDDEDEDEDEEEKV